MLGFLLLEIALHLGFNRSRFLVDVRVQLLELVLGRLVSHHDLHDLLHVGVLLVELFVHQPKQLRVLAQFQVKVFVAQRVLLLVR